ncbi:MAG TPA: PE-PPE domain-containing protein, partial [Mycobacterium sp.]|nr:PE-PPE domain-containing protein [Mycobacterium sp.]
DQGRVGDTTYYLIPAPIIPLLIPLEQVPVVGYTLADTLDPTQRVLVEAGYNRSISPGTPTKWNLLYFPNPIKLAVDFVVAIPTGLDNGVGDLIGIRPFGTKRPGPYGVGGPSVTYLTPPAEVTTLAADLAKVSQLTSVLGGVPASDPSSPGAAAAQPAVTTNVKDVGAAVDLAAPTSTTGTGSVPDVTATVQKQPLSGPNRGSGTDASLTPVVTSAPQPLIRQPIDSNPSGPKTTGSSGNGPVGKVLDGLLGGPKAPSGTGSGVSSASHRSGSPHN